MLLLHLVRARLILHRLDAASHSQQLHQTHRSISSAMLAASVLSWAVEAFSRFGLQISNLSNRPTNTASDPIPAGPVRFSGRQNRPTLSRVNFADVEPMVRSNAATLRSCNEIGRAHG